MKTLVVAILVMATNAAPKPREVGANYFEPLDQSQIWVNVEPDLDGAAPVIINLTVAFPGLRLDRAPATVAVRAQPRCAPVVFPDRIRRPILTFTVDRARTFDLTARGRYDFVATCSGTPDTVIAPLTMAELRAMANSKTARVEALGFALALTSGDLAAWRRFIQTVEHGIAIKYP